jgi:hypothetical protein
MSNGSPRVNNGSISASLMKNYDYIVACRRAGWTWLQIANDLNVSPNYMHSWAKVRLSEREMNPLGDMRGASNEITAKKQGLPPPEADHGFERFRIDTRESDRKFAEAMRRAREGYQDAKVGRDRPLRALPPPTLIGRREAAS